MEASAAGLAAGGDSAGGDGQDGAQQQQAGGGGDAAISQLADQMAALSSGQEEMRAFLDGIAQQQGGGQEQQEAGPVEQQLPDLSVFDDSRPGYSEQQAAEALQQLMSSTASTEASRLVQETVAPLQQQVADMRMERETDQLVREFPALGDEQTAQQVVDTAKRYATALGQPELVGSAEFMKLVYLAGRATELAQQQDGAADGAVATLEGAGGARPGGAGQGADPAEAIRQKWSSGGGAAVLAGL